MQALQAAIYAAFRTLSRLVSLICSTLSPVFRSMSVCMRSCGDAEIATRPPSGLAAGETKNPAAGAAAAKTPTASLDMATIGVIKIKLPAPAPHPPQETTDPPRHLTGLIYMPRRVLPW